MDGRARSGHVVFSTVDLAIGATARVWRLAGGTARRAAPVVRPVARLALRPPGVPVRLQPGEVLTALGREGELRRATVQQRLDVLVPEVLTAVIRRAHLNEVLPRSLDLGALAEGVIDEVDLPEIIRESTGSMASETVRGARMQGSSADETVGRVVDRLLLRRGPRSVGVNGDDGPRERPRGGP